jgi:hypothetical protein
VTTYLCPRCSGDGTVTGAHGDCPKCNGAGRVNERPHSETVEISVNDLDDLIEFARQSENYEYQRGGIMDLFKRVEPLVAPPEPVVCNAWHGTLGEAVTCEYEAGHEGRHRSGRTNGESYVWATT